MSDKSSIAFPCDFTIVYSDDDVRAYRKFMAARYDTQYTFFGLLFVAPLAIGLVVLGASQLGLFPPIALRAVLLTAYVAFFLGAATYYFIVRRYFRRLSRSRLELLGKTCKFIFDEAGVSYRSETADVRLTWRGIDSVEDGGRAVFFMLGWQAIFIPSRVFPDSAARFGFLAATAARIKAATESARP